ncbi:synapsin-1-like [Drosophila pseudoobscura]|uniref:Synapsin-1-like n=1 Tax=Drosophila pseudoobscura pseudoobscura TaxID=46245 RepID=A0A6I8VLS6_DROPS|nr:synapsin-1 [Drosophila pseudoobscura]
MKCISITLLPIICVALSIAQYNGQNPYQTQAQPPDQVGGPPPQHPPIPQGQVGGPAAEQLPQHQQIQPGPVGGPSAEAAPPSGGKGGGNINKNTNNIKVGRK